MGQLTDLPVKGKDNGSAMGAFGDRLRREREMRSITLDEISESTKISRRHLEALEGEHFDQLPGGVFNKGFVRAYARFLGLNEDQAVADYSAANQEQPEPEDKFPLEVHEKPKPQLNRKRSRLPMAFGIATLVGVLVGYGIWVKFRPHGTETASVPAAATSSASAPVADTPAEKTSATKPAPAAVTPVPASHAQNAPQQVAPTPVKPRQQAESATPTPPPTGKPEKAFFISIKAKEDSWVSIVADGKSVMQRVLAADKHKKIKAGKELVLRTGNAGGIEVSFNGRPLGALGNENEPRTLTFNSTGLVQ